MASSKSPNTPAKEILKWYDTNGRDLPWRKKGGERADPYHVWLSEIMLQQTTVAAVIPYFHKFLMRWPTIQGLADAALDDVLAAWSGLGYYARARNLHKCAKAVTALPKGQFPETVDELRALPGIGPYTAGAISAIAFNRRAVVVDGNVERVVARLRRIETVLPKAKPEIAKVVSELTPHDRPGDFAQAMMDLGATVCTPRKPDCPNCPWARRCEARAVGDAESFPRKAAKSARPARRGAAFVLISNRGRILLRRRPEKGLLGGMYEPPGTHWGAEYGTLADAPVKASFEMGGDIKHVFTHFELSLRVFVAFGVSESRVDGVWVERSKMDAFALPNVMRKVIAAALAIEPGKKRNRGDA